MKKVYCFIILIILLFIGCTQNSSNDNIAPKDTPSKNNNTSQNNPLTSGELSQPINSGLLLGISSLEDVEQDENDDPKPVPAKYKTIWISPQGSGLRSLEQEGMIIAPGSKGFYIYENVLSTQKKEDSALQNAYEIELNKMVSYNLNDVYRLNPIDNSDWQLVYYSETNNLLFAGNNYSIIETSRIYTSGAGGYQFVPSIDLCKHGNIPKSWMEKGFHERKDAGALLKALFDSRTRAIIEDQIKRYKKEFNKTVKVESDEDREYISEGNLSLERREGKWRLVVPIMFSNWKDSHNFMKEFKEIRCNIPSSLVSHDNLCLSWKYIKKVEPDAVDAVSSPDKKLLVVQTSKALKVYINSKGNLGKPVMEIPVGAHDRIILNQWATGKNVAKWDSQLNQILN